MTRPQRAPVFALLAVLMPPLSAGLSAACHRTEEPPAAPSASAPNPPPPQPPPSTARPATEASAARVPAPATAAKAHCLVSLSPDPPPLAQLAATCPPDPEGRLSLRRGSVQFSDAPGAPRVAVELAVQPHEHERGLMFRREMPKNEGMLFLGTEEHVRSFWMHNTCIPLDMLFVAMDGVVVGILEQVPTLNDLPRGVSCPSAHVLEVNAGWARAHGIQPGMRLDLEL